MTGSMQAHTFKPPIPVEAELNGFELCKDAFNNSLMNNPPVFDLHPFHPQEAAVFTGNLADVEQLPATAGIEDRAIEDNLVLRALLPEVKDGSFGLRLIAMVVVNRICGHI